MRLLPAIMPLHAVLFGVRRGGICVRPESEEDTIVND